MFSFTARRCFSCSALKCVSMNNLECKVRPEKINITSHEPSFYLDSILVNECSGICNNIDDSYTKLCVSNFVKIEKIKVFNNETRHIEWRETCKFKCRLDLSVFNNKQRWSNYVNVKNWLTKADVIMDLFGILVHVNTNVINHVTLENISKIFYDLPLLVFFKFKLYIWTRNM